MYTVGVYADQDSDVLGLFSGRKVRGKNPVFGDCVVGQAEEVPRSVIEESLRLVHRLRYTGVAEVEYKKDARNGRFRLIELNPRSWSWVGITPYCGVNLPLIAYDDMVRNRKRRLVSRAPTGSVKWALLMEDFRNCLLSYFGKGETGGKFPIREWASSLRGRIVAEDCSLSDPLPSLVSLYRIVKADIITLSRKLDKTRLVRRRDGETR
jgi:predicted ATP-grasp superfamily ATP-dependent carboligase